ncbi:MAG: NIF family HAD-type phosphatase, partial [Candidatus Sericytochromatia bacterium]
TLIHSSEAPLPDLQADFRCGDYFVHKRPHLDSFWEAIGPHFELAIWSSGTDDYAAEISRQIRPPELAFSFVWGRTAFYYQMTWPHRPAITFPA